MKSYGTHAHAHVHARTCPMCLHATSCGTHAHQVHSSYSLLLTLVLTLFYKHVLVGTSTARRCATPVTVVERK
jgi:hypothetical protein